MSIYAPQGAAGMIHSDVDDLVRLIQQGDGMGWPGDPRMYVGVGVLVRTNRRNGQKRTGRRYEVWRHCEDGEDRMIAHWRLEEKDRIIFDLARMRLDAPGHVDALDEIDANNAKIEAAASDAFRDHMGEAVSHGADVLAELTGGKNRFRQMPGLRDAE